MTTMTREITHSDGYYCYCAECVAKRDSEPLIALGSRDDEEATLFAERVISELMLRLARRVHVADHRGPDQQGLPYKVWRAIERRIEETDEWERMVREYPLGLSSPGPDRVWRKMDEYRFKTIRDQLRPMGQTDIDPVTGRPRVIMRNPQDHAPAPKPRQPVVSSLVHIQFPDWA